MMKAARVSVLFLVLLGLVCGLLGLRGDDVTTGSSGSPTTQTTASNQFSGFTRGLMNEYLQQQLTKAPQPSPYGVKSLALAADPLGPVVQDLNGVLVALTIPASAKTNESFDVSVTITTTQASVTQPVLAISDKFPLGAYNIAGVSPTEPPADFSYSAHQPTVYNYGDNIAGFNWSQVPVAYQAGYKFINLRENVPWLHGGYIFEWYNDHITWTVSGLQTAQAGNYNFAVFIGGLWISADGSQLIFGPAMVETTLPVQPGIIIPNAPSNLVAMAVSSSQINLTWQDNSNNEDGFIIERKNGLYDTYTPIVTVGSNTTHYTDENLFEYSLYYYRMKAYNQAGSSDYSNEAIAVTLIPVFTVSQIKALIMDYYQNGLIKNYGLYNSLGSNLDLIENYLNQRNFITVYHKINSLLNEIEAQSGQGIASQAAQNLSLYINQLFFQIGVADVEGIRWEWKSPYTLPYPPWVIERNGDKATITAGENKTQTTTELNLTNSFAHKCVKIDFFQKKQEPQNQTGVLKYGKAPDPILGITWYGFGKPVVINLLPTGTEQCKCKKWGFIQLISATTDIQLPGKQWERENTIQWGIDSTPKEDYLKALKNALDTLVKDGKITEEQRKKYAAEYEESIKGMSEYPQFNGSAGVNGGSYVLRDWPETYNPWQFVGKEVTLENGEKRTVIVGTKFKLDYEFKTWIICTDPAGVIGYVHWGFTMEITIKGKEGTYEKDTTYSITRKDPVYLPAPGAEGWDKLKKEQQDEIQKEYNIYKKLLGDKYSQFANVIIDP